MCVGGGGGEGGGEGGGGDEGVQEQICIKTHTEHISKAPVIRNNKLSLLAIANIMH